MCALLLVRVRQVPARMATISHLAPRQLAVIAQLDTTPPPLRNLHGQRVALVHLGTSLLRPVLPGVQLANLAGMCPSELALSVPSVLLVNMVQLQPSALVLTVNLVV